MQAAEARLYQLTDGLLPALRPAGREATSCAARAACASSRTRARTAAPARPGVARVPVLRGRGGPAGARPASPPAADRDLRARGGARDVARARLLAFPRREEPPMDQTLILVKPDAFARGLTGEIVSRFERKGLRIAAMRLLTVDQELAERHYAEHEGKPFFEELVEFITSGPIVALVLEGEDAVDRRAPGDRGHEPARGRAGLDPRRLRDPGRPEPRPRLGLAPSRPSARWRCSSARLLILASRSPAATRDPRAPRGSLRGPAGAGRGARRGRARRGRARERAPQGARGRRRRARPPGARRRHRRRARRAPLRPARRRGRRRASTLRALAGRTHEVVSGLCLIARARCTVRGSSAPR